MSQTEVHGTNSSYSSGCHCQACCEAHTQYSREYRTGQTRTVDATPVREWLRSQPEGVTVAEISRNTGIQAGTLRAIRAGMVRRTNRKLYEAIEPWMSA